MINFRLTDDQRKAIVRQRAKPFKYLYNENDKKILFDFDRLYAKDSFIDATIAKTNSNAFEKIIDIGCGNAGVAAVQNILYNAEIFLIDGNRISERDCGYAEAESMNWYSTWNDLPQTLKMWGCNMDKVHFININDAKSYDWPKVDIVQSFLSCGAHYPIDTYKWLYEKINQSHTRYIFTTNTDPAAVPSYFKIINTIEFINEPRGLYNVLELQ